MKGLPMPPRYTLQMGTENGTKPMTGVFSTGAPTRHARTRDIPMPELSKPTTTTGQSCVLQEVEGQSTFLDKPLNS